MDQDSKQPMAAQAILDAKSHYKDMKMNDNNEYDSLLNQKQSQGGDGDENSKEN